MHRQKVNVSLFIDADGNLVDVTALNAPAKSYYRHLRDIMYQSPVWIPGTNSGTPFPTEYALELDIVNRSVKMASYIDS